MSEGIAPERKAVNPARTLVAAGQRVIALTVRQVKTPDIAFMARACGFDIIIIDAEHGRFTPDETAALCLCASAIGLTTLVRVASQAEHAIASALDCGASGVIVPHVNSVEEARSVSRHAHYAPLGTRSIAAVGPPSDYRSLPLAEHLQHQNASVWVIAMLETPAGIAEAAAIAAVPGIDGLLIGPNDLSASMGLAGQLDDPSVREAYAQVAHACHANRRVFMAGGVPGLPLADIARMGAQALVGGIDVGYLMSAARADAAAMRGI
jgi:2-keto-3-deoxy-L-rhamnonate aldolase RhmA